MRDAAAEALEMGVVRCVLWDPGAGLPAARFLGRPPRRRGTQPRYDGRSELLLPPRMSRPGCRPRAPNRCPRVGTHHGAPFDRRPPPRRCCVLRVRCWGGGREAAPRDAQTKASRRSRRRPDTSPGLFVIAFLRGPCDEDAGDRGRGRAGPPPHGRMLASDTPRRTVARPDGRSNGDEIIETEAAGRCRFPPFLLGPQSTVAVARVPARARGCWWPRRLIGCLLIE